MDEDEEIWLSEEERKREHQRRRLRIKYHTNKAWRRRAIERQHKYLERKALKNETANRAIDAVGGTAKGDITGNQAVEEGSEDQS
jgi:uncharacterized protein (DUF2062 family)